MHTELSQLYTELSNLAEEISLREYPVHAGRGLDSKEYVGTRVREWGRTTVCYVHCTPANNQQSLCGSPGFYIPEINISIPAELAEDATALWLLDTVLANPDSFAQTLLTQYKKGEFDERNARRVKDILSRYPVEMPEAV